MKHPNVPTNYEEYLLWHLEGYDLGNMLTFINSEWILSNFTWLYQNKLINRVDYIASTGFEDSAINIFIDNSVATYSYCDQALYNRAYSTIACYAPHELDTA
jgi:hypothetical protein